jgi:putative membrane protein
VLTNQVFLLDEAAPDRRRTEASQMRVPILSIAFALVLGIAGCNRNDAGNSISTDTNLAEDAMVNEVLGAPPAVNQTAALPTDASGFANVVAASDMFEIESAKLAADKGASAEVKAFATQLLTDHEKSSAELKAAAAKATPPVTMTPALDAEQQAMLDQLKSANGADFDRRFIDQQTNAHQKALVLLQHYVGNGDSQPLKDLASKALPVVQDHLEQVNRIRK